MRITRRYGNTPPRAPVCVWFCNSCSDGVRFNHSALPEECLARGADFCWTRGMFTAACILVGCSGNRCCPWIKTLFCLLFITYYCWWEIENNYKFLPFKMFPSKIQKTCAKEGTRQWYADLLYNWLFPIISFMRGIFRSLGMKRPVTSSSNEWNYLTCATQRAKRLQLWPKEDLCSEPYSKPFVLFAVLTYILCTVAPFATKVLSMTHRIEHLR